MDNTPMKVKLLMHDCEGLEDESLVDFYIKANKITGWYVPYRHDVYGEMLTIFIDGEAFGIKQEPPILEYLRNEFIKPLKK